MNNRFLQPRVAADINKQVAKLLRELGKPEPPLSLAQVCDARSLDRTYYSSDDDGLLRETIHKLKVAGKQILARPSLIKEAIAQADLKALYLHDRKRILIDATEPEKKLRWREAHEIGHSLIPWHAAYNLGDDLATLTPTCHAEIENEANFAAGQLLFLQDRFVEEARSIPPNIDSVKQLAKRYANSHNSTLWRLVEAAEAPLCGVVSEHPVTFVPSPTRAEPVRYFVRSRGFEERFSRVTGGAVFSALRSYWNGKSRGPLGTGELLVPDDNGDHHVFLFETFNFTYDTLTLGVYVRQHASVVGL